MSFKKTFQKMRQYLGKDSTYDWYGALVCFTVLLVVMFIVNTVMFVNLTVSTPSTENISDKKLISVSQADIQKTIESTRQKDVGSRNVSTTLLTDPSL